MNSIGDMLLIFKEDFSIFNANYQAFTSLEYDKKELIGMSFHELFLDQDRESSFLHIKTQLLQKQDVSIEGLMISKRGAQIPVEVKARHIELGGNSYILAMARDISLRKSHEAKIHHLAYYDSLTGLPNRSLFLDRLHQVLVNLLGNAAKFTEGGTITLGGTLDKGAVELTVEDTGIGIPASALPHLFDRFTMVDDSSTKQHDGTGLGLALSRDLARRMGGELTARSQEGLGSVFTVRLPLAAPQTTPMPARPSPPAPA